MGGAVEGDWSPALPSCHLSIGIGVLREEIISIGHWGPSLAWQIFEQSRYEMIKRVSGYCAAALEVQGPSITFPPVPASSPIISLHRMLPLFIE